MLKDDNGVQLPIKEGIVLDSDESVVLYSNPDRTFGTAGDQNSGRIFSHVFKLPAFLVPLIAIGIVVVLTFGALLFGSLFLVFIAIFILHSLVQKVIRPSSF